jgi:hypothetical protein
LQYEIDNLEIERDVLQARVSVLEASAAVPEGLTLVPVIATREIEDAIGRNRNMKACEIWEEAVSVASKNTQKTGAVVPKWVKCSDRLPTVDDADCKGEVWVCEPHITIPVYTWDWWQLELTPPGTSWMSTGLKLSQPPERESTQ